MMWCFAGSYLSSLTPEDDRDVRALRRRRDDHLLRARGEVLGGAVAAGEDAGRLEHDVDAEVLPRQLRRILDRQHLELVAVDGDSFAAGLDVGVQVAEHRVVLEQMRERGGVGEIVDRDEIDVLGAQRRAHDVAPDAAEPVDPDLHCHRLFLEVRGPAVEAGRYDARYANVSVEPHAHNLRL